MRKTIYVIDVEGYFISEMLVNEEELPFFNYTESKPPEGYRPKWDGNSWSTEPLKQEEASPPTIYERIDAIESALMQLMSGGI